LRPANAIAASRQRGFHKASHAVHFGGSVHALIDGVCFLTFGYF
jgi:hypothetical protein